MKAVTSTRAATTAAGRESAAAMPGVSDEPERERTDEPAQQQRFIARGWDRRGTLSIKDPGKRPPLFPPRGS